MTEQIFRDKTFPRHIADLMNLMHMMVFQGTDGEEQWETYLSLKQKEYIALGLAIYYQCDHCIEHHRHALSKLESGSSDTLLGQNTSALTLFLRIDTRSIGRMEKEHWMNAWSRFAKSLAAAHDDPLLPYIIGLAIGIARNDDFLIDFCGQKLCQVLLEQGMEPRSIIGEIEAVVIFMKAAASKNRVVQKVERLLA